ncbi:ATP-dependent RNA helicase dbp9 [Leucoagaricus sp. SymC.cos]|nr:ATP-dependent RNA helicase dbp9 [Leucoagaricus sp. SymC.cos]
MAPDARLIEHATAFSSFSNILDSRLLRALADMRFARPTLIQARAIPLALDEHRDILARARTGSGKTAAYCLPVVQKILLSKGKGKDGASGDTSDVTRALILVPTRELAEQITAFLRGVVRYCDKDVVVINVASGTTAHLQRVLLSDHPDIVVATPSRALSLLQSKTLSLSAIDSLVIDEADLILSYGHDNDVRQIFSGAYLPKVHQSFLMSATMTEDVEMLKGLTLRNPAILKLEEDEDEAASLSQYAVRCSEVDKFLLTYVILKLKLVSGKCILFVNDVDRCYRLKLFLEQFSIKSCVLNSELPLNSRYHTVQEFNKGVYDYIIATDEVVNFGSVTPTQREDPDKATSEEEDEGEEEEALADLKLKRKRPLSPPPPSRKRQKQQPEGQGTKSSKKTKGKHKSDKEYGVTRGVDFVDVACVLNFDLPTSARSYTHRVGRTARAGRTGMSLSFIIPRAEWGKNKVVGCLPSAQNDERIFKRIEKQQAARGSQIKEYKFDMHQVEAFRYRMEDALRSVTRAAIREARIKELKNELLNSDKLKAYFEDNPLDLEHLRHDKALRPARVQPHMKHIPRYLLPKMAPVQEGDETRPVTGAKTGFVPFRKDGERKGRHGKGGKPDSRGKKKSDPLKKFR